MKGLVRFTEIWEAVYFNCTYCGRPIFLEVERRLGWCGCKIADVEINAPREPAERRVGSEALVLDDGDPYGQPIFRVEG